jgi:glycosyltransferase involved in cell wall biosynthesis
MSFLATSSTGGTITPGPRVSFVVPCYKLGHLLHECVESILGQTFADFEVLIMDDCSPDNTPEVARSFSDPRVIHIRNEPNLRHLGNYNKGISLARGNYIWLVSADDKLRRSYVLERFVRVMDAHPEIGFAFCPGVGLADGRETGVLKYTIQDNIDIIYQGRNLFLRLLDENSILAASGLVRRECYEKLGMFPLDLPFSGDWYLWCLFSLNYDAAYFAEPMVCYREHELSMSNALSAHDVSLCLQNDLLLFWRIRNILALRNDALLLRACDQAISEFYAQALAGKRKYKGVPCALSLTAFNASLCQHSSTESRRRLQATTLAKAGDHCRWQRKYKVAADFYGSALRLEPLNPILWCKYFVSKASSQTSTSKQTGEVSSIAQR